MTALGFHAPLLGTLPCQVATVSLSHCLRRPLECSMFMFCRMPGDMGQTSRWFKRHVVRNISLCPAHLYVLCLSPYSKQPGLLVILVFLLMMINVVVHCDFCMLVDA